MSWWVYLEHDGKPVSVENHSEGGTYAVGGISDAELNITYNYGRCWRAHGWGNLSEQFDGKTGRESIPELRRMVELLGTDQHQDYWEPNDGNAGHALSILLRWAEQYPDAVWRVS